MRSKPVDIIQQFVDQHAREDMLGFFDVHLPSASGDKLEGLCKISGPIPGSTKLKYLSLTFTVDTPDDAAHRRADEVLTELEGGALSAKLPQVVGVVPVPSLDASVQNYVRQIDFLLEDHIDPGQFFVAERLLPAIAAVTGLEVGEVVWWDEAAKAAAADSGKDESGASLARRVANHLRRLLS